MTQISTGTNKMYHIKTSPHKNEHFSPRSSWTLCDALSDIICPKNLQILTPIYAYTG